MPVSQLLAAEEAVEVGFDIRAFEVTGNTIFPSAKVREAVTPFKGPGKTSTDVEKARDALEKLYHDAGYPTVMVNIPEQTLKDGVVKLEVVETRIGNVKVTGNKYFTIEKIMSGLPSLRRGRIIYIPDVQNDISRLNRNPDFKVTPSMSPGMELGTVDVELKVEDRLPVHGYLEINNRASHDTTELRLNGMIRYDNLWQKEHSLTLQYQTAPMHPKDVEVGSIAYVLPAPWNIDHQLVFYGVWSDSNTAFGEGFAVVGKGQIAGTRYVVPMPPYKLYTHNISFGLDYKHFDQAIGFTTQSGQTTHTPVTYLPLSFSYNGSLPDESGGLTQFSAGLNMSFRGIVSDETQFELKRFKATANYIYGTAGVQRSQKLPWNMNLLVKGDVQVAAQPLINNEQYSAGGMENVRGYLESEALGDNAVHGTVELSFPDPLQKTGLKNFSLVPFVFYDIAYLKTIDPQPGQNSTSTLDGTGAGIRGSFMTNFEYEVDWAVAMQPTARIPRDDERIYFKVKANL